jgi:hypothetical protein
MWMRTARQLDERTGKMVGGRPMMVDWPLPPLLTEGGRLLAEPGKPVPNLGVKKDQHGSWIARVLSEAEPLRAEERPGIPHWATCKNPPHRERKPRPRPKSGPTAGQAALDLDVGGDPAPRPGLMSMESLFPRRRSRRG